MNNKSNFRRGSVELLILHLLSQQDYYGYEISTLIREQTDGYLNIPVGSLYPASPSQKRSVTYPLACRYSLRSIPKFSSSSQKKIFSFSSITNFL